MYDGMGVLPLVSDPQGMRKSSWNIGKQYYYMDGNAITGYVCCWQIIGPVASLCAKLAPPAQDNLLHIE